VEVFITSTVRTTTIFLGQYRWRTLTKLAQLEILRCQSKRVLRQCKVQWAEVMFVTIQRENIRRSEKEMNKVWTCPRFSVRLWMTSPYRWPVGNLPSTRMLCTPPHCTKDVCIPQGSTRDLWTVHISSPWLCYINHLKPSGNYMYHLLYRLLMCVIYDSHNNQRLFS
jgi:hypothetical protein